MAWKAALLVPLMVGAGNPGGDPSPSEKERLVRQTLATFYTHLMADHPPSECPAILDGVEGELSEMSSELRASLGERDATAAAWKYLRIHRDLLALGHEATYGARGLNVRYDSFVLGPSKDEPYILLHLIGGMNTQKTGIRKEVGFMLSWNTAERRYHVSVGGLTVNGIVAIDPAGQFDRPADLWRELGFPTGSAKR